MGFDETDTIRVYSKRLDLEHRVPYHLSQNISFQGGLIRHRLEIDEGARKAVIAAHGADEYRSLAAHIDAQLNNVQSAVDEYRRQFCSTRTGLSDAEIQYMQELRGELAFCDPIQAWPTEVDHLTRIGFLRQGRCYGIGMIANLWRFVRDQLESAARLRKLWDACEVSDEIGGDRVTRVMIGDIDTGCDFRSPADAQWYAAMRQEATRRASFVALRSFDFHRFFHDPN